MSEVILFHTVLAHWQHAWARRSGIQLVSVYWAALHIILGWSWRRLRKKITPCLLHHELWGVSLRAICQLDCLLQPVLLSPHVLLLKGSAVGRSVGSRNTCAKEAGWFHAVVTYVAHSDMKSCHSLVCSRRWRVWDNLYFSIHCYLCSRSLCGFVLLHYMISLLTILNLGS